MIRWLGLLALLIASPTWAGMQGMGPVASSAGASSIAVTAPTVQSNFNCELLAMITNVTGGTASLSGWTAQQTCTAGSKQTTFLTKAASGTEGGSYTFSLGSSLSIPDARIYAFCGVNTSSPVDHMGCNTTVTTPSLTASKTNEDMLLLWHGGNGASPTAWPTGPTQAGIDGSNGGEAAFGALITNTSAQSFALTITTSSPYSGAIIFNNIANNRAWGVKSRATTPLTGSVTSISVNAPINIVAGDKGDAFIVVTGTPTGFACSGGSTTWSCPDTLIPSGEKLFHCTVTGLAVSDTTYSCSWTGAGQSELDMYDEVNVTGQDAFAAATNASASTCITPTVTSTINNEPILNWCTIETGSTLGGIPNGVAPLTPPGGKVGTAFRNGWAGGFTMQASHGATSASTWTCTDNCGSAISGGVQIAKTVATPVPTAKGTALFMSFP